MKTGEMIDTLVANPTWEAKGNGKGVSESE
jgi:hypothetical protein